MSAERHPLDRWRLLLGLIGLFFAALMFWGVRQAMRGGSPVSDAGYYNRGLAHGEAIAARERAQALGWAASARVEAGELVVSVRDAGGNAVSGLAVRRLDVADAAPFRERAPGLYAAPEPAARAVELEIASAEARLVHALRLP